MEFFWFIESTLSLFRLTWPLLINFFALVSLRLEGLWSDRPSRMIYLIISAHPVFAYKPLRSHELEVGGLMVRSAFLTDLPHYLSLAGLCLYTSTWLTYRTVIEGLHSAGWYPLPCFQSPIFQPCMPWYERFIQSTNLCRPHHWDINYHIYSYLHL